MSGEHHGRCKITGEWHCKHCDDRWDAEMTGQEADRG